MRKFYHGLFILMIAFFSTSCTSTHRSPPQLASNFINRQNVITTTRENYPAKNPQTVALYKNDQKPLTPYKVIGVASVSKYNMLGMQRQEATLHQMMKKLAASIGGDGLINMDHKNDKVQAHVIAFQKILL